MIHSRSTPQHQRQTSQCKGLETGKPSSGPKKRAGLAILISNKIDIKGKIHQDA